ncbi:N-acetylmuramoyl-L-alanine amidase (Autolysine) [Planococcus antarcticus DSM 14505]|uniref:N-acetylmuramoyl-L-alanine amidase (Autolysine) n=2 Tax=Planococcus TaxID=1372 RepID=A0AA87LSE0_9BACL|nr:N-acetylmuramoyl-L-alanine amidase (Autolysine) [Planococcus antarcticus DSM 14505]
MPTIGEQIFYLSFHHNANTGVLGTWTGTENFVHPNSSTRTHYIAQDIQDALVTAYNLKDRGAKSANFQVLRETNMPAILIKGGFMDSLIDIQKLGNKDVLKQAGKNAAQTVAQYGSLKRKQTVVDTNTIHTVIAGDTLWGISRTYGVKVEDIRTWNNLKSDVIIIGQKLIVKKPVSIVTVSNSVTTAKNKRPAKKPTSTKVKYPLSTAILRNGSRGESVKQLQRALNKAKFKLKGKVDGIFGPATRKALNKVVN